MLNALSVLDFSALVFTHVSVNGFLSVEEEGHSAIRI